MNSQRKLKNKMVTMRAPAIGFCACLFLFLPASGLASAKTAPKVKMPASTAPTTEGCDGTKALSREDRLAVLTKVTLETENEIASELEGPAPFSGTTNQTRERIRTFAAGSLPDSVRFVSMDQSCWASFYEAQQRLAKNDDIGALSASKEWKDCLIAQFPERVAVAEPYFSCFLSAPNEPKK